LDIKYGETVAKNITILTLLLGILKIVVGVFTGITIIIADGLHSLIDVLPIFASWVGLKLSLRPADKKFPYGYYKAESIALLFISIFLIFAAIELMLDAYNEWQYPNPVKYDIIILAVPLISAGVSIFIYFYETNGAKKSNSKSLEANAKETMFDVISSLSIFISLILVNFNIININPLLIGLISIMILKIGFESLRDSFYSLMDVAPLQISDVEKTILQFDDVKGIRELKIRKAGPMLFGEAIVLIPKTLDMVRAHELSGHIENELKSKYNIERFIIHFEPYKKENVTVVIPVKNIDKIKNMEISNNFGRAKYLTILKIDKHGKLIKHKTIDNPYLSKDVRAGLATSKMIEKYHPDIVIVRNIGEISFHTLRDALIEIHKVPNNVNSIKDAVKQFIKHKTTVLTSPTKTKDKE